MSFYFLYAQLYSVCVFAICYIACKIETDRFIRSFDDMVCFYLEEDIDHTSGIRSIDDSRLGDCLKR